jgi:hypothetical protein
MQDTSAAPGKPSASERLKALIAEWGPLFFIVWFGIFAIVMVGFFLAIQFGFKGASTESTPGTAAEAGTFAAKLGAAYLATQLTKPLRIAATVVLTPALGAFLKRFRRPKAPAADASAELTPVTREPRAALDEAPSEQR